jgi:hypothetical protein
MGAEVSSEGWTWLHAHLHQGRAANLVRGSAAAVQRELLACYELIGAIGRGRGRPEGGCRAPQRVRGHELGFGADSPLGCGAWSSRDEGSSLNIRVDTESGV